jgi:two-component system CAI-1 autoinducer sensor kinase/phosphatase CqsS
MNALRRLYSHYESYHLHGPQMLLYAGILGTFAFPALYALRFAKSAPLYDDFLVRLLATFLCLALLLRRYWPARWRPYYIAFSYPALIYSLPMTLVFTSLKNGGGVVAVSNTMLAIFFVILMTDWRNTIVMLTLGALGGVALYLLVDPNPGIPWDYVARTPVFFVIVCGGCLFKLAGEKAASNRIREAYAALAGSIAHEVRTPLSQIKQSIDQMQACLPTSRTGPVPDWTHTVRRGLVESELAVRRGLQVVAMTLDEVNARPLDPDRFHYLSAADVCGKAIQEYGYESEEDRNRVRMHVEHDFLFRGDETAYLFVLFNLIKNSLYYAAARPRTEVTLIVRDGEVVVRDTGPGISKEVLPRLFEPFASQGKADGTGLGLAYCRRIVHAFGATIRCESAAGEFTEFIMGFPRVSVEQRDAHRAGVLAAAQRTFQGRRVLLVDDDSALRTLTRHKLRALAIEVDEAADGAQALGLLKRQAYDLLVLDLHMPGVDGYELVDMVRSGAVPGAQSLCIVAYTSEPVHLARVRALRSRVDGFVSKPCEQIPLVQALLSAIQRSDTLAQATPGQALTGRRIVIADDVPVSRKAVAAYLRAAGAVVVEADHGDAVLDLLVLGGGADAVVMDLNMPGRNGLSTARAIRHSGTAWSDVPLVALTAHSGRAAEDQVLAAGMDGFLTKPVDAEQLYEALVPLLTTREPVAGTGAPLTRGAVDEALLNTERLAGYQRLGLLDELLADYLPAMERLVTDLARAAAARERGAIVDALHSLLGLSGEAGAQALHAHLRAQYAALAEQGGYPPDGWMERTASLTAQSCRALRRHAASGIQVP